MTSLVTPHFSSAYADAFYEFVEFKRRQGYKYNGEIKELQRLDKYFMSLNVTRDNCSEKII